MGDRNHSQDGELEDATVEIDPMLFRSVMGHYPTGVTVVAALEDGHPVGLAIGSFFSVSLDPPLVGFCVARTSSSWPRIEAAGVFGISVLAEDQQETSGRFASKVEDKFEGETWRPSDATGSPTIAGALAHIDCSLHSVLDAGDHVIVLGRVLALDVHRDDVGPLLFFRGGYGRHSSL
jgi:3-hydroxy-9,10-secoandrosta-1,3,5(10)-triene-9,17-dione monooxygenase reductase component